MSMVIGGQNISHMIRDDRMSETGGILGKILRCLKAKAFPSLQCKAIEALQACGLISFQNVANELLKVFKTDGKHVIRSRLADCIFHKSMERGFRMEGILALRLWLGHMEVDMRFYAVKKCKELRLINKDNIILLTEDVLVLLKDEEVRIRTATLEAMYEGRIAGNYLEVELNRLYEIVFNIFKTDMDNAIRVLAAKLLLNDVSVESASCYKVAELLGAWAEDMERPDLYHTCILASMYIPAEYWTSVDLAQTSSTFRDFSLTQNLSVQLILKLIDSNIASDSVKLSILRFILHLGKNRFSLRLLTTLLDSENFSRLYDCLKLENEEILCAGLQVILDCFVPRQTDLSNNVSLRVQELLADENSSLEIKLLCSGVVLKFDLSTYELCKVVNKYDQPAVQKVGLQAIREYSHVLLDHQNLVDAILSEFLKMGSANLVIVFEIFRQVDLKKVEGKKIKVIKNVLNTLLERMRLELNELEKSDFGVTSDKKTMESLAELDSETDKTPTNSPKQEAAKLSPRRSTRTVVVEGDTIRGLSPWCMPAINVVVQHVFLLNDDAGDGFGEEAAAKAGDVTRGRQRSASNFAQRKNSSVNKSSSPGKKKFHTTGAMTHAAKATLASGKRLTESLLNLLNHRCVPPLVLENVCSIFRGAIEGGNEKLFLSMIGALNNCSEPDHGLIILNALERVRIHKSNQVTEMLKSCLNKDGSIRGFCFKPLLYYLEKLRSQEECEWTMPSKWSDIIKKGMDGKITEISFLMKELRLGGMLSTMVSKHEHTYTKKSEEELELELKKRKAEGKKKAEAVGGSMRNKAEHDKMALETAKYEARKNICCSINEMVKRVTQEEEAAGTRPEESVLKGQGHGRKSIVGKITSLSTAAKKAGSKKKVIMVDASAPKAVQVMPKKSSMAGIASMLSPKSSPRHKRKIGLDGALGRRGSGLTPNRRGSGLMLNGGLKMASLNANLNVIIPNNDEEISASNSPAAPSSVVSAAASSPASPKPSPRGAKWGSVLARTPRSRKNAEKEIDFMKMYFTTITDALEVAEDGDEIHVYAKADGSGYIERLVINKSVEIKGCARTPELDKSHREAIKSGERGEKTQKQKKEEEEKKREEEKKEEDNKKNKGKCGWHNWHAF